MKNNEKPTKAKTKIILDVDTGIDDAMALAYSLGDPNIELLGVVGTYGNVRMTDGVDNSLRILEILNRRDIPVYEGAPHSLHRNEVYEAKAISQFIHGKNGLGNIDFDKSDREAEQMSGIDFIIESAKKYGKELVIVATGPMTDLAFALRREPNLKNMVGNVVIMGGALTVRGNINNYAEANIFQDPFAANELFQSGIPVTMVGLDVTLRTKLTCKGTQTWKDLGTKSGKRFADMVDYYIKAYGEATPELAGCALHDPLAVAVAAYPDLVSTHTMHMSAETGKFDWGRTVGNAGKLNDKNPNVKVCINVDHERFVNHFTETLNKILGQN